MDAAQLQLKLRHEPRSAVEAIEAQYAEHARQKPGRRPLGFEVTILNFPNQITAVCPRPVPQSGMILGKTAAGLLGRTPWPS